MEAMCGNFVESKAAASAAIKRSSAREVRYAGALALALSADFPKLEAFAYDLEQRLREDTFVKFTYVPFSRR